MADVKVSGLPSDSALDGNHYTVLNDPTGPTTKRTLLSTLAAWLFDQINIPSGSGSPVTRADDLTRDFVLSGLAWSGDAVGSTRNASMTSGFVYINGRKIPISAVSARAFTASKDTYVDVLDNADGTGTLVYTEVANNAASPALASNSIRIATVVTGATTIAAATSIGQGGFANILPVISSQIFRGFDSLGNLIYPKGPSTPALTQSPHKFLVYRAAAWTDGNGGLANVTFDTKVYDTGANYATGTGLFTAPVAGFYLFTWSIAKSQTANTAMLSTLKQIAAIGGGITYYSGNQLYQGATTGGAATVGSALVQMAVGDTAQIQSYGSGGAGTVGMGQFGGTYFTGHLVTAS